MPCNSSRNALPLVIVFGVQCEVCNEPVGGVPVVSTNTAVDGTFTLKNVPATSQVPLIVQKGRFRKQIMLNIPACQDTPLTVDQARLPRKQSEGDLPKMAVGVGDYDQIECVLRSIGLDEKATVVIDTGVEEGDDLSLAMNAVIVKRSCRAERLQRSIRQLVAKRRGRE